MRAKQRNFQAVNAGAAFNVRIAAVTPGIALQRALYLRGGNVWSNLEMKPIV